MASRILGELGADVVKVEPLEGDKTRKWPPFAHDEPHHEKSLYFLFHNLNKRSVTLNIEHPHGVAIFKQLIRKSDVVIESFPVGYLSGLGLSFETLLQVNPRLVVASVTDFGQTGSHCQLMSSDLINMGMGGYLQLAGETDGAPVRIVVDHSYLVASLYAAVGVVTALHMRHSSGQGQHIDVSAREAILSFTPMNAPSVNWFTIKENPARSGIRSELAFPSGAYKVKDGWVNLTVWTPRDWEIFAQWACELTGDREYLDPMYAGQPHARWPYKDYLDEMLDRDFFSKFTKVELFHEAQKRGIVASPLNDVSEVVEDPHLNERGFFVDVEHPVIGKVRVPKIPFYCDDVDLALKYRSAPLLGEHNVDIYCGELGLSKQDLCKLRCQSVS